MIDPESLAAGLGLTAVGLVLTASFGRDLAGGLASVRWPRVRGRVVGHGTHPGTGERGDEMAVVVFEYEVDGVTYRGSRYDFAGRNVGFDPSPVLLRHAVGEAIDLRVDPRDPSRAVVQAGVRLGNFLRLALGVLLLVPGLLMLLGALSGA